MTRQEELERSGWRRMTTIDEPRLSELVETYRELGHEVHVEPVHADEEDGCVACLAQTPERYGTIYIRPTCVEAGAEADDDLFE